MITIDVLGSPTPKGSNRAMVRGGRAVFVPGSSSGEQKRLKSWDRAVREATREVVTTSAPPFVETPLAVAIVFRLARPGGHWGTGKNAGRLKPSASCAPAVKPDIDKLARATLDALTGVVFDDDARIVELVVMKRFASPGDEGARIVVRAWTPT